MQTRKLRKRTCISCRGKFTPQAHNAFRNKGRDHEKAHQAGPRFSTWRATSGSSGRCSCRTPREKPYSWTPPASASRTTYSGG